MSSGIPKPVLFMGVTALESLLITLAIPQHLPEHPLLYVFFRLFAVQLALYLFYAITIYPRFVSPLRHLPEPKVRSMQKFQQRRD